VDADNKCNEDNRHKDEKKADNEDNKKEEKEDIKEINPWEVTTLFIVASINYR